MHPWWCDSLPQSLEQLFGTSSADDNADADNYNNRNRMIMSDILGGMSIRILAERERARKRERLRRIIIALKGTSLAVRECHLIPNVVGAAELNRRGGVDVANADIDATLAAANVGDNDREGRVATTIATSQAAVAAAGPFAAGPMGEVDNAQDYDSGVGEGRNENIDTTGSIATAVNPPQTVVDEEAATIIPAAPERAVDVTPAPQSSGPTTATHYASSLHVAAVDLDDDCDNKYSALCLPNNGDDFSMSPIGTVDVNLADETMRLVPATCAICLLQYTPGCFVSWSENPVCKHVFHRDCMLMWLLKKEEPLCPCCRAEFILESELSGDGGRYSRGGNSAGEIGEDGDAADERDGESSGR